MYVSTTAVYRYAKFESQRSTIDDIVKHEFKDLRARYEARYEWAKVYGEVPLYIYVPEGYFASLSTYSFPYWQYYMYYMS